MQNKNIILSRPILDRLYRLEKEMKGASESRIKELCKDEVKELKGKYSTSYVLTCLCEYRKHFKGDYKNVTYYLAVGKEDIKEDRVRKKKRLNKKNRNKIKVVDWMGMIEKAKDLLLSDKYQEVALGLSFLTGRRLTEIVKTARFTHYRKRKYMLNFEGQLKEKRGLGKFPIYALGNSAHDCKVALSKLRGMIDVRGLSNKEVERKYNVSINQRATVIFKDNMGRCSAHRLRAVYAAICCELYMTKGDDKNNFTASIMGHNALDTDSAMAYKKYML